MIHAIGHAQGPTPPQRQQQLAAAARQFEAVFLSQMLAAAGAGKPSESFGGGAGESQFASFLLDAQAQRIAERGGIGIAEIVLRQHAAQVPEAAR